MWRYQPSPDNEYLGNIWGWKFSLLGGLLIVGLLLLGFVTARIRGKPFLDQGGGPVPTEQVPQPGELPTPQRQ